MVYNDALDAAITAAAWHGSALDNAQSSPSTIPFIAFDDRKRRHCISLSPYTRTGVAPVHVDRHHNCHHALCLIFHSIDSSIWARRFPRCHSSSRCMQPTRCQYLHLMLVICHIQCIVIFSGSSSLRMALGGIENHPSFILTSSTRIRHACVLPAFLSPALSRLWHCSVSRLQHLLSCLLFQVSTISNSSLMMLFIFLAAFLITWSGWPPVHQLNEPGR